MNNKILLVEDEAITAYCLYQDLLSCGFDVCEPVATGKDAIRYYQSEQPYIVILDLRLSGKLSGLEVAEHIKASGNQVMLIFMTGYSTAEILDKARSYDPRAIMEKPVIFEELIEIIKSFLSEQDRI